MKDKTIAQLIIAGVALAIFTGIFSASITSATEDNLYMISGLMMMIFGIWGAVRLWKSDK